jgi:cytochrome c6
VNGGNIIQANATLFQADLEKYGFADSDSLYKIIYSGKGRMPGFGTDCAPRVSLKAQPQ